MQLDETGRIVLTPEIRQTKMIESRIRILGRGTSFRIMSDSQFQFEKRVKEFYLDATPRFDPDRMLQNLEKDYQKIMRDNRLSD